MSCVTVMHNWLDPNLANAVADRIESIQDWSIRICDKNGGPRIVPPAAAKELGLSPEQYAKQLPLSLEELAKGGTMAYLFFVKALSQFDSALFEEWNSKLVYLVNGVMQQDNNYVEEPQVTMYTSGCFLGQHSDGVGSRQVAFVANFTRNWQPDFGGCLTVLENGKWTIVEPKFNSLVLMNVRGGSCHYVSQVASWVDKKRIAITGWVGKR